MARLLAKHPLPHINVALVIALVWAAFAVAAALYDVEHMVATW
jgi:hypothetical protein